MKKNIRKYIWAFVGIIIGGIVGYFYYRWVGCQSGTCPITSKPLNSIAYGAFMGFLLANIVRPIHLNSK